MFDFFKKKGEKLSIFSYKVEYKKPKPIEEDNSETMLFTLMPISAVKIPNRYKYNSYNDFNIHDAINLKQNDIVKPFKSIVRKSTNIPNIAIIEMKEDWFDDDIYIVNDKELVDKCIKQNNKSFTISGHGDCIELWTYETEDNKNRWSSCGCEYFFKHIASPLIAIFGMSEQQVVNSFAPGIIEVLFGLREQFRDATYSEKETLRREVSKYLIDIYNTISGMNGFKEKSYLTVAELINMKDESERIERERELAIEQARKDAQDNFINELKSRRSLLKDFNRPLDDAIALAKKQLYDGS